MAGSQQRPPSAVRLDGVVGSLAENTAIGTALKLADIVISDDGRGTNTISLLGADADLFQVVGQTLVLKAGTSLNFEQKASLTVTVQVADAGLPGSTPVSSACTVAISNLQEGPGSVAAPLGQGGAAPSEGITLLAASVVGEPDGISSAVSVDWLRNGTATGQSGSSAVVGAQGAGSWQSRHVYTDGAGQQTTVLSAPVVVGAIDNGPGSLAAISADGPLRVGMTLTAGGVTGDPDGDAADPQASWQWLRNGVAIAGPAGTARTYQTSSADLGASLSVTVSVSDAQNFRRSLTSAAVGPILEGTPPAVSGITVEGLQVAVSFNEAIQATAPPLSAVQVLVGGQTRAISSLSLDATNRRLVLNLTTAVAAPRSDETVRVIYGDPAGDQSSGVIQDSVGNDLAGFSRDADSFRSATTVAASPALASPYISLVLTGSAAINGTGNANANLINGNSAANALDGAAGDDDLRGAAGNDTLVGGSGNDSLRGGAGLDLLSGGPGNDLFDCSGSGDALIGGTSSNPLFERISDLQIAQSSGTDRIDTIATGPTAVRVLPVKPTALNRSAITTLLNGSSGGVANFGPFAASIFTFGSGSGLRTFLAINDANSGYDSSLDQIIEISGASGILSDLLVI